MGKHHKKSDYTLIKKSAFVATAVAALIGSGTGVAFADPDFGPGNSSKGPQDPGAACHPPGQTVDLSQCK